MRRTFVLAGAVLALAACSTSDRVTGNTGDLTPPANLTYQLIPSGDPDLPEGIELRWDPVQDPNVADYAVFSRSSSNGTWNLRAQTTSPSFEDLGQPDLQYYVASQAADGTLSVPSNAITVDANNQLPPPSGLIAIELDQAIQLSWLPNARQADPSGFSYYRVYSTVYHVSQNLCDSQWVLEGTTVSEDFIASGLPNGQARCFDVSAISVDGHESEWPTPVAATPTASANDIVLFASPDSVKKSGFAFVSSSRSLGVVASGANAAVDFRLDRRADGSKWIVPVRSGTRVALFSAQPVADLNAIDVAPRSGFSANAIQARARFGYVFQTPQQDGVHYVGMRVTAVGSNYIIFRWSYQHDAGNPTLQRMSTGGGAASAIAR